MANISAPGKHYPAWVKRELEKLAAEWPDRDFWWVHAYMGHDSWSSRPKGDGPADIIRYSPDEIREALTEPANG